MLKKINYFITGIGTNVGKTIVSALLTEALQADYWKPIQSGTIEGRDSETVTALISNTKTQIHNEAYLLKQPLSPHFAAKLEDIYIDINTLKLPDTNNTIIIEGAGGIFVPLNEIHYVIDIAKTFNCEIILVISNYLGCINHTLLSLHYLMQQRFIIKAIIFNGNFEPEVEASITNFNTQITIIKIPMLNVLTKKSIAEIAKTIRF